MGRKKKQTDFLTDFEVKIMNIIWALRSASVADVVEKLRGEEYAYTTISTVMRLLEQKQILSTIKNGRSYIYIPELSKEDFEATALGQIVKNVFEEDPSFLVRRLIDSRDLSSADLAELKELIDEKIRSSETKT